MGKISVVGSINIDLTMFTDKFPNPSENILAYDFITNAGGKGANQAVAAARFGSEVSMIGCVGNDTNGVLALKRLKDNNIDTSGVIITDKTATGTALINVSGGENSLIVYKGANSLLTPEAVSVKLDLLEKSDLVLLQYELPPETVEFVIEFCDKKGIKTLVNPAPDATLTKPEWIDKITYLIPNANEIKMIFGTIDAETAVRKYPRKLIVTLGPKGSLFCDGKSVIKVDPIKIIPVDPTGAGDTFCGVLGSSLSDGIDLKQAVKLANIAAGLSTTKKGCQSAMPYKKEVMDFLNNSQ